MKVYFVRHGESELNAKQMHQPFDSKLSLEGIKQAEFLSERLSTVKIDEIISSPFERAKQTAEIIANKINRNVIFSDLFVERKRPTEVENKHTQDPAVIEIKKQIKDNYHNLAWKYSDEENFQDVKERSLAAVRYLEGVGKENVLIVTHGTILRAIIGVMMFGDKLTSEVEERTRHFMMVGNTGLTMCEFKENKWKLITWNDQAHLGD
jgi:broad specificity phosphatase PhoE